jgi:hypothetical protein
MRLDTRAFAIAAGATAAILFLICALAIAIAPDATTAFAGQLIHADLSAMTRNLTLTTFVIGLVAWPLGAALSFWFAAVVYNRLAGRPVMR